MDKRFARKMTGRLKMRGAGGSPVNNGGWLYSSLRPNSAGVVIDEVMSLTVAAIWRGVNVKAGDLAKLSLNVYERLAKGGSHPDFSSRVYELLSYPNETRTGRRQRHVAAVHLTLWGNSYQEIIRDPETGDPLRLELLDPRLVVPRREQDGRLVFWLKGSKSPWSGKTTLLPENVIHFSGLSLNGDGGLSTIQTNNDPIGTASALDKYAGSLWGNGAQPNGVIEVPAEWGDDARNNFRQAWVDEHGGVAHANRTAILEEGAKFVQTGFDPEKLQMLASREFSVVEIARIIGIPPHKLFDMSHDVQRSLEEMNIDYYETEIEPIAQMMADEYSLKLLVADERKRWYVAFDMTNVMKGTALERAQANQIRMQNGVITANEWRAEDGSNPFEQDVRMMPLNMKIVKSDTDLDPDPAGDGPTDPEPLPAALADGSRKVLREALGRMTRREVLHLRKESAREYYGPAWLETYYAGFEATYAEAVTPALQLHATAIGKAIDAAAVVRDLINSSKKQLASTDDVQALLNDWDAGKVDQAIETIEALP